MAGDFKPATVSEQVVKEHAEGWLGFTRFMTISIIAVLIVLVTFVLQFGTGWGFAVLAMVLSYVVLGIAVALGKL